MTDYDQAAKDLERFIRWMRREYPGVPFLAVAEKQQRGAWHWHIALRDWVNIVMVRKAWTYGQVNIKRKRIAAAKGRAAAYLAKYLSKSLEMAGRAAYRICNRAALTKPKIVKYILHLRTKPGDMPEWIRLTAAFRHLASVSYVKDGIYWRFDHADELHHSNFEIRARFGEIGLWA